MSHTLTIELSDHAHEKMQRIIEQYRSGVKSDRSLGVDMMHKLCVSVLKAYLGDEVNNRQIVESCGDEQLQLFPGARTQEDETR